ncbi:MAG: hypothetical protein K6B28_01585 [Lachnospiraceae bacterium]|nr:hypothetical protein [Lachnospiraceae bacterium]
MKRRTSGSSLFLMEMIITILFFSIACAICVQSFVTSKLLDEQTKELNSAINIAQGLCDAMRGTDGSIYGLTAVYDDEVIGEDDSYFQIYYDKDFNVCSPISDDAMYVADVTLKVLPTDPLATINVIVTDLEDYKEIYSLTATKFLEGAQG